MTPIIWLATICLCFLSEVHLVTGKVYDKCELAHELHYKHGIKRDFLHKWMCLIFYESSYNSSAVNTENWDSSQDHGLFQINDRYWCQPSDGRKSANVCQMSCDQLRDDDLRDDMSCVREIFKAHGWSAWVAYVTRCQNLEPNSLPSHIAIDDCPLNQPFGKGRPGRRRPGGKGRRRTTISPSKGFTTRTTPTISSTASTTTTTSTTPRPTQKTKPPTNTIEGWWYPDRKLPPAKLPSFPLPEVPHDLPKLPNYWISSARGPTRPRYRAVTYENTVSRVIPNRREDHSSSRGFSFREPPSIVTTLSTGSESGFVMNERDSRFTILLSTEKNNESDQNNQSVRREQNVIVSKVSSTLFKPRPPSFTT